MRSLLSFTYYITFLAITTKTFCHCPPGSVVSVQSDFSVLCQQCPEGCAICMLNAHHQPTCIFCDDGYYSLIDQNCKKCFENCASCVGPEMSDCRSLKMGFYYDHAYSRIKPCEHRGCSSCDGTGNCFSCTEGYFLVNSTTPNVKTCKSCEISNCLVCSEKEDDLKNNIVLACTVCKSGYSLMDDQCIACPEHCQFCMEGSRECILCKQGFWIDPKVNQCQVMDVPNCNSFSPELKCMNCENRFYLSVGQCYPCQKSLPNCSYCRIDPASNVLGCLNCESGYFFKDTMCQKCSENCNHCSADKCLVCMKGHFFNESTKKCEKCPLENCDVCSNSVLCETCRAGFYVDKITGECTKLFKKMWS